MNVRVPLLSMAVAIDATGERVIVDTDGHSSLFPGTRVVHSAAAGAQAENQRAWLRQGWVPREGSDYASMVTDALLDLHVLTLPDNATVAGWPGPWRYVWPRDSAFVAVALARTGHGADAVRILEFLQDAQADDGSFQARYLPDQPGRAPDARGEQSDGLGWSLWALAEVVQSLPAADRQSLATRFRPLVSRSTSRLLALTDTAGGLPPPSMDYWEVKAESLSLGTAAPVLLGLRSALKLADYGDAPALRDRLSDRVARLASSIDERFGTKGYPRYIDGTDRDASVAFLMPPFADRSEPVTDAWESARQEMRRPAGGLAPGAGWKRDGISWTPETALFAWTAAASGRVETARQYMRWLDGHRTPLGALPEKVLSNGAAAGPAPLAWTAALVVLTAVELEGPSSDPGR